jgi:phosphoribosyl-AMP cyclohydrolase
MRVSLTNDLWPKGQESATKSLEIPEKGNICYEEFMEDDTLLQSLQANSATCHSDKSCYGKQLRK